VNKVDNQVELFIRSMILLTIWLGIFPRD